MSPFQMFSRPSQWEFELPLRILIPNKTLASDSQGWLPLTGFHQSPLHSTQMRCMAPGHGEEREAERERKGRGPLRDHHLIRASLPLRIRVLDEKKKRKCPYSSAVSDQLFCSLRHLMNLNQNVDTHEIIMFFPKASVAICLFNFMFLQRRDPQDSAHPSNSYI